MRISRTGANTPAGSAKTNRSREGGDFSSYTSTDKAGQAQSAAPAATGGVASVGAVDAVMALQGVGAQGDNRQRALRKGRSLLDALDRLTISMLDQNTSTGHLQNLRRALGESRDESGDAGLDAALSHIEVRAAVEIAKLERRKAG